MKNIETLKNRPVGTIDLLDAQNTTEFLNELLSNEYALFTKTLNYHWNVTGSRFHSLHSFLETQYNDLLAVMDNIAERVRVLGETPNSTVKEMYEGMSLEEKSGKNMSSSQMIGDLFENNQIIQESIKGYLSGQHDFKKDPGTEDFLVGVLQKHEMMSWKLKSHLD